MKAYAWQCEHCDCPVTDVPEDAEVNERRKCRNCKHHTVVFKAVPTVEPAMPTERERRPTPPRTPGRREIIAAQLAAWRNANPAS